jgi:hypothetical protein
MSFTTAFVSTVRMILQLTLAISAMAFVLSTMALWLMLIHALAQILTLLLQFLSDTVSTAPILGQYVWMALLSY